MSVYASRRLAVSAAAAAAMLSLGSVVTGTPAAAATVVLNCSGSFTMTVGGIVAGATGSGDLQCESAGQRISATISMQGSSETSGSVTTTRTTDTITYSSGGTTELSVTRTFTIVGPPHVNEHGEGTTASGRFHPARSFEAGEGTAVVGEATTFTIDSGYNFRLVQ
ncbi:hypothetical protein [Streptomyces sp. NPDC053048]|uniref:hypothetical protein n=1 Tax=Streptomyces sp. NPDC053048 TaxID=3365694 RepID=UPI0037D5D7AD